ncbi:hypothetical protein NQ315_000471 [Exocentrus adspersus]|uniref:Tc1-like transposase DDE domain-containing protein n=1 Tax=Exocentrus adspersus TaxID=1586481 RepID=A0AAV8VEE8_9CUCU|nr:hypothetical protein NQ315_000471 [Exocentrus adspersus]
MERLSDFIPTKRVKRCALSQNEKIIILNVYNALKYQYPTNTITDTVTNCSKMTGIGISTIYRLIKDTQNGQGTKSSTGRSKVVIEDDLKNDNVLPKLSRNKLWSVLRELNFCWEKQNRKSILNDKDEIICWRRSYLRSIRKFREEGRNIYYLDETWVNEGYTVTKVWQDKNVKISRQAFFDGLSTGFKAPSGDYHEDMNANVFEEYFLQMLDLIPPGSVIVLDNASYHSRQTERTPTTAWKKADIIHWLSEKNVSFETNMVKIELLTLVNLNKGDKKYVIDEMAASRQITVLRLPPYHCELNSIELVWAQVKGDVARYITSFKLSDVKILLENSLERISGKDVIHHVHKEEEKMWELDNLIDVAVEALVINLGDEDSSDSEDEF